ncbi:hypothetical protein [Rubinisphaera margarita]|uniref:hypothetical protein n=1 Tax=Rubinisphaera margarita TaxID=2909586 RepID=UPI001EE95FFC|nr:hypothetical protein [Rubinisphaera margarita]MCG6154601.1 hypothetical protein [Rubinisphaera margarita]
MADQKVDFSLDLAFALQMPCVCSALLKGSMLPAVVPTAVCEAAVPLERQPLRALTQVWRL